jgi:hypothetical protein
MNASLQDVVNLGSKVQKLYQFSPVINHDDMILENLTLEYDFDNRLVEIIDTDSDESIASIDISLFDEDVPDMTLDKKIFIEFLQLRFLKMYAETDDYSDIL